MIIVSGVVATNDGLCRWDIAQGETTPDGTLRVRRHRIFRHDPPADYAAAQPVHIPVLIDHDKGQRIGEVLHLERRYRQLYAVGRLDIPFEELEGRRLHWSPSTDGAKRPFRITEMSLTADPASVGLPPVRFYPESTLERAVAWPGNRQLIRGAIDAQKRRRRGDPISIFDPDAPDLGDSRTAVSLERSSPALHVSTSQRIVEVVAVPYEQEARVYWRDQWWTEVFQHGAFREFIRSGGQLRVNREHRKGDTVGKVVELRETTEGLIATVRIAQTARGDETLELAKDDMISASIGFSFIDPGGRIVDHNRRTIRVLRARLDHLALVESPAYDGARVLAVRRRS